MEEACIIELNLIPTLELRAFLQAAFIAKLTIAFKLKDSKEQYVILTEDFQNLLPEARSWNLNELVSDGLCVGLNLYLSSPTSASLPMHLREVATVIIEALDEKPPIFAKATIDRKISEAMIEVDSRIKEAPLHEEVDLLTEAIFGIKPSRLELPPRRSLSVLEEFFKDEKVREEAYRLLSYLRDANSTFKALLELTNLSRDLAKRVIIKLLREKLIDQVGVGGVKMVALTDLGRLVLEEYECSR